MEKVTQKDIDWLLNLDISTVPEKVSTRPLWIRILILSGISLLLLLLPFFLLIRSSVYLHVSHQFSAWPSLISGMSLTILLLLLYLLFIFRKFRDKQLLLKYGVIGISTLVLSFCVYGSVYLSSVHSKTETVRSYYRSLNPILRVTSATISLADKDFLITDIKRSPEDYLSMGLTPLERSMHYPQKNGYVHAIDIRTIGKSEVRNRVLQASFFLLGFETLRHTGTADHLHISLPLSD